MRIRCGYERTINKQMQNAKEVVLAIPSAIKSTLFNEGMYTVYGVGIVMLMCIAIHESGIIAGFLTGVSGMIICFTCIAIAISIIVTVFMLLWAALFLVLDFLDRLLR